MEIDQVEEEKNWGGNKYNTNRPKGKLNSMQVAVRRGRED